MGLVQPYFTKPDDVAVQCWIHTTFLFPDTVNQIGDAYCSFWCVDYTPLGTPCDNNIILLDHSDTITPFIVTAYPALVVIVNHFHHNNNVLGFNTASMN